MHKGLKTLYVFIFLLIFLLCGCGENNKKAVASEFTADFSASYGNMQIKGSITSARGSMLSMIISSPSTLDGLGVEYRGAEMQIKRDELICSTDEAYIPNSSFPSILKEITGGISDGRAQFLENKNGSDTYELRMSGDSCVINCTQGGEIESIKTNSDSLYIEFSNFKVLGD